MATNSGAGTRVYIGPTTAAATIAAYKALTYVEIGEIEKVGDLGDTTATATYKRLADRRVVKRKGSKDAGKWVATGAHDPLDAGQLACWAADASDFPYAIKIQMNDGADANDTDSLKFYHGLVSMKLKFGDNDTIVGFELSVDISTAIFTENSTAVP